MENKLNKYEMKDRKWGAWKPKFGGNLKEFIRRMVEDEGFVIATLFPFCEGAGWNIIETKDIQEDDYDEMAYQALNFEHTNMVFVNGKNSQTISIMMTGDDWCDIVPINDWSFRRDVEDVVDKVITEMREEILGDDA